MARGCKILLSFIALFMCMTTVMAIEKPTKLYMYGFSASFNDSTIYMTEIMEVDSVWTNSKTDFLYGRDSYSYQLKTYLQEKGITTPTCVVSFAKTRKEAEKKYMKLRSKYINKKKGSYTLKYIASTDFKFETVSAEDDSEANTEQNKQAEKAQKKAMKAAKKQSKQDKKEKADVK